MLVRYLRLARRHWFPPFRDTLIDKSVSRVAEPHTPAPCCTDSNAFVSERNVDVVAPENRRFGFAKVLKIQSNEACA